MRFLAAARWCLLLAFSATSLACDLTLPWSTTEPRPLSAGPASVRFEKAIDDTMSVVQGAKVSVSGGPPEASYLCTSDDPRVADAAWMGAYVIVHPGRPSDLGVGTWTTRIRVAPIVPPSQTPLPDWPPATIDVTYVVHPADLTLTPARVSFEIVEGMPLPVAQTVRIDDARGSVPWTAHSFTSGGWYDVSPTSGGGTPGVLTLTVNATHPSVMGTDTSYVEVAAGDRGAFLPVTVVSRTARLTAAPASISFQQVVSQTAPGPQGVALTYEFGTGTYLAWASGNDAAGRPWLQASTSGAVPGNLTVQVIRSDLPAGRHQGTVTVAFQGTPRAQAEIPVVLDVTP